MKNRIAKYHKPRHGQIITTFGKGKLVLVGGKKVALRDGTRQEETMAKEWISLFLHEALLC